MIKGKTKSGFEFEINEEQLNDYRFLKEVARVEDNPLRFPFLLEKMLSEDQEERLMKHLEDDNGRVDPQKVMEEVKDIFQSTHELKN